MGAPVLFSEDMAQRYSVPKLSTTSSPPSNRNPRRPVGDLAPCSFRTNLPNGPRNDWTSVRREACMDLYGMPLRRPPQPQRHGQWGNEPSGTSAPAALASG